MHLAELSQRLEPHWHRCHYGRLCALVPLAFQGRCIVAFKLATSRQLGAETFARGVELLDVLVENLTLSEAEFLSRWLAAAPASAEDQAPAPPLLQEPVTEQPLHPQVRAALDFIGAHLANPQLSVRAVARALSIHPDYLAHLFAMQVGQRMSRYISTRRVEHAKELLVNTDWQIKRIARETGYANPNWFSYVFHTHTGLTPREHRRRARKQREQR